MKCKIYVISGPSGVGKGTVIDLAKPELRNFVQISTITTRSKRKGIKPEKERRFVTHKRFKEMIKKNELLEYNFYNGNFYGPPRKEVENILKKGKNVLLKIDINGAKKIKKQYGNQSVLIFIWAKLQEIEKRLRERKQNTEKEIKARLKRAKIELKNKKFYDYQIYNQEGYPEKAAQKLVKICNK